MKEYGDQIKERSKIIYACVECNALDRCLREAEKLLTEINKETESGDSLSMNAFMVNSKIKRYFTEKGLLWRGINYQRGKNDD